MIFKILIYFLCILLFILNTHFSIWIYLFPLIILFLTFTDTKNRENNHIFKIDNFEIEKQNLIFLFGKIIIIGLLIFLGQFFLYKNNKFLGYISYFFVFIQLVLFFKIKKKEFIFNINEEVNSEKDKIMPQLFYFTVLLYFIFMALISVKNGEYKKFFVFFIWALPLGYIVNSEFYIQKENKKENRILQILTIIIIFLLAFFVRFFKLLEIPPGFYGDDTLLLHLINEDRNTPLPIYSYVISDPTLSVKIINFILKYFDVNIFTVKLISAIFGSLNVVFLYLLTKLFYNNRTAIIASLIIIFMFQHILFSRKIEFYIFNLFFLCLSIYFFFLFFKKLNNLFLVFSGINLALNLYFYKAGRIAPLIFLLFILVILFLIKNKINFLKVNLIFGFSFFIAFIPLLYYIINNMDTYLGRIIYTNLLPEIIKNPEIIFSQIKLYLDYFFVGYLNSGMFGLANVPAFDSFSSYFFLFGFLYIFINKLNYINLFILIWLFISLLVGLISKPMDNYAVRIIMFYPIYPILTAIGIENISNFFLKRKVLYLRLLGLIVLIGSVLAIIYINLNNFFYKYPEDPATKLAYRYEYINILKYLQKNKRSKVFYTNYFNTQHTLGQLGFILSYAKIKGEKFDVSLGELNKIYNEEGLDVILLGEGIYNKAIDYYKIYFKNAEIFIDWNYDYFLYGEKRVNKYDFGWKRADEIIKFLQEKFYADRFKTTVPYINFIACKIPYNDIKELFSINLKLITKDNVKNSKIYQNEFYITEDTKIYINSLIEVPEYDIYEIKIHNIKDAEIFIDGVLVKQPVKLYKGLHKLNIRMNAIKDRLIYIMWKKGNKDFEKIPIKYFVNSNKINGLLAFYKNEFNKIIYISLEPILQFNNFYTITRYNLNYVAKGINIIWKGYIEISEDGFYEFKFDTDFCADIIINNKIVMLKADRKNDKQVNKIYLSKGLHKIEINSFLVDNEIPVRLMFKKDTWNLFGPVQSINLKPKL